MKNIVLLTCMVFLIFATGCSSRSEEIVATVTTQTDNAPTQTLTPIPSKTIAPTKTHTAILSKTHTPTPTQTPPATLMERIATHGFPKLYNGFQAGYPSDETLKEMERLSLWDVITVDAESLADIEYLLGPSGVLRTANPNLVITVYFSAGNSEPLDDGLFGRFVGGLQPNWLLQDVNGEMVGGFKFESGWVGFYNHTAPGLAEYFANFIQLELLNTGLFDGVFYDWGAGSEFNWLNWVNEVERNGGPIDLNQDGIAESNQEIDSRMVNGMRNLHIASRDKWGDDILILGNGGPDSTPEYVTTLNGNGIENFLSHLETGPEAELRASWSAQMMVYASYALQAQEPRVVVAHVGGGQNKDNFNLVRYSLASTLLFDGYYAISGDEQGGDVYSSTWWYDEYAVNTQTGVAIEDPKFKGYLGNSLGPAFNAMEPTEQLVDALGIGSGKVDFANKIAETKIWRRDFENGIVLVNPTSTSQTIDLGGTFRKIQGTRDPEFNDGSEVNTIVLLPESGIVLLR